MATPPSGFGSIEHEHRHAGAKRRLHRQHHRPDVRVVAAADVLQIDHQHVDATEIGRRRRQRLERLAVQADHRDPGAAVLIVVDADHVLRLPAHAVLRPEEPHRPDADLDEAVDDVGQVGRDAGGMAEHPDATAAQSAQEVHLVAAEDIESALDVHPVRLHHAPEASSSPTPCRFGPGPRISKTPLRAHLARPQPRSVLISLGLNPAPCGIDRRPPELPRPSARDFFRRVGCHFKTRAQPTRRKMFARGGSVRPRGRVRSARGRRSRAVRATSRTTCKT